MGQPVDCKHDSKGKCILEAKRLTHRRTAMEKTFTTLDIYVSSYLALQGIEPRLELRNGKVVFTFEATDTLYQLMNDYNSNALIEVADFATAIKTLRGKMLSAKESITDNGKGRNHGAIFNR
jgi:hypothetical protein